MKVQMSFCVKCSHPREMFYFVRGIIEKKNIIKMLIQLKNVYLQKAGENNSFFQSFILCNDE